MSLLLKVATSLLRSGCWAGLAIPLSFAGVIDRLRGSGKVLMFPSSSLNGLRTFEGNPGALDTVAIVCKADVLIDFETGRGGLGVTLVELVVEEYDRRCCKDR